MDAQEYQRIRSLFLHASELTGEERHAYLAALPEPDRVEVQQLLGSAAILTSALTPEPPVRREFDLPHEFGRYRLVAKLGEGGMGVVYAAEDSQLGRRVAIKTVRSALTDGTAQQRLLREARAAAGINHPHICQVLEIGEFDGELFIAMELLEGEPLSTRLERGPLPLRESLPVLIDILAALQELHDRGIVHRDLKPSNVFLTPHGIKLLDFGLARSFHESSGDRLTQTGMFAGTPGFMAPELFSGGEPGPAADLFAVGALAIEMIAGVPAFPSPTPADGFHAVMNDSAPNLTGGPAVAAADLVIQRALAKSPSERPQSAAEMAVELRAAADLIDGRETPGATNLQRLLVIPFRMLRADEEIAFLPLGLADALNTSLSGLEGLVVLSSHVGMRYADGELDFADIAEQTGSQLVLTGTLLRAGDRLRVATQLIEVPSGEVVWTESSSATTGDLFLLQDEVAGHIVDSLALKIAPGRKRLQSDVPANAAAYQYYLRANQLTHNFGQLEQARDLYERCLAADPNYAPAWAQLGRLLRIMVKYGHSAGGDVDAAFRKALEINPNLSLAHHLYAYHQIEERGESRDAMVRLLRQARRRPTDPQLLCGLVVACRFCGLLDASIEADRRARRLDPGLRTSVHYTYWAAGDLENALRYDDEDLGWIHTYTLPLMGRTDEALARCREREQRALKDGERALLESDRTALERDRAACLASSQRILDSNFRDPEGRLFCVRNLVYVGELDAAFAELSSIVERGFFCEASLNNDPWFDPVRSDARFVDALAKAEAGRRASAKAYEEAGGIFLLGPGLR
ncbi:MAG: protein kinase domain-containing protein [Planctomycetota bacterium]